MVRNSPKHFIFEKPTLPAKTARIMDVYDVIIVGGGPAGLKCAEVLGHAGKHVLLLEKKQQFGDKLCAGGLTPKGMALLHLPRALVEHSFMNALVHSRHQHTVNRSPTPLLYTVNRHKLGRYQADLLKNLPVTVRMNSQVTEVSGNKILLKDGTAYGFRFLVGAEGYASLVRNTLQLPREKRLLGFQYTLPIPEGAPALEIHLDAHRFNAWYAWIFPHKNSLSIGFCCDPQMVNHRKMKTGFLKWLEKKNINPGSAKMECQPICYDYKGTRFGNIFLAGEAAGLACGLTGEGIYQSLVSGQEVARMIIDPDYVSKPLRELLRYNRRFHGVLRLLRALGPFKGLVHELLLFLITRNRTRKKINAVFS